ncbi:Sporulation protein, partial [Dysosmobacter welbionis]
GVCRDAVGQRQPQATKKARRQGTDNPTLFLWKRNDIIGLEGADVVFCHGQLGDLHILCFQIAGDSCRAGQNDLGGAHTLGGQGLSVHRGALNIHLRHMAGG